MIIPRPVLVRAGIIDSARVCALPIACQLFFRNLLHACDGRGLFPADADELRAAFYRRAPGVSKPHVEAWLTKCHQAGLVNLYTRGGKGYGELINFGQRDTKRAQLYPPPDDGELNFTGPPPDPDSSPIKQKRSEGKGKERVERAAPAPESQEIWLARLRAAHPAINIDGELRAAAKNRAAQGRKLERQWFETHWIGNLSTVVDFASGPAAAEPAMAEPEAWRAYLNEQHHEEEWANTAQIMEWKSLPRNWQEKISREARRVW